MDDPVTERPYEPLGFLSGSFKGSAENRSVPEKEGFTIVESMTRMDYITLGRLVHLFTDHVNLLVMYDPPKTTNSIPKDAINKLMCCAICLSAFNYVIENISGEENYWADMLSRWDNREHTIAAERVNVKSLMLDPCLWMKISTGRRSPI